MNNRLSLQLAIAAVRDACTVTRNVQQRLEELQALRKADRSPVTVADYAAQAVVAHALRSQDARCVLVAEESAEMLRAPEHAGLRQELLRTLKPLWPDVTEGDMLEAIDFSGEPGTGFWTLDPIDGTKGFLRRGQYAVSLAYVRDGEIQLGVLGCPNLSADFERPFDDPDPAGLIFYAARGDGCWALAATASAAAARVMPAPADGKLRICESAESGHSDQSASIRATATLGGAEIYRLDSQAKYAVVARGQADAYLRIPRGTDYSECIWDHAAGALIATEAGARVSDIAGKPLDFSAGLKLTRNQGVICAAERWHSRLIAALASARSGQDLPPAAGNPGSSPG